MSMMLSMHYLPTLNEKHLAGVVGVEHGIEALIVIDGGAAKKEIVDDEPRLRPDMPVAALVSANIVRNEA